MPRRKFSGEESKGLIYGTCAFLIWGFTPFYFNALDRLRVEEIVAHRIVWCAVFLVLVLTIGRQWPAVGQALRNRKVLLILFITALLNSLNWGVFIYSVVSDQLLASSLGYRSCGVNLVRCQIMEGCLRPPNTFQMYVLSFLTPGAACRSRFFGRDPQVYSFLH